MRVRLTGPSRWLHVEHRDADGFSTAPAECLSTQTHARTAERLEVGDVFEILVGICRWTARALAYAALMRDGYALPAGPVTILAR